MSRIFMWGGMLAGVVLGFTACGKGDAAVDCPLESPECHRNTLATCDDAGVVVELACAPGRCAFDAPVPLCVPAGALPCDPLLTPPTCENGQLLECPADSAYRLARDCGAGQICSAVQGTSRCEPLEAQPCSPATFQPLCVAGRRIECMQPEGPLVEVGRCGGSP